MLAFCWPTCPSWTTGEYLYLPSGQPFPAELLSEKKLSGLTSADWFLFPGNGTKVLC